MFKHRVGSGPDAADLRGQASATPGKQTLTEALMAPGRVPSPATAGAAPGTAASARGPLPDDVRERMERSFGFHLSAIRVFEGPHVSQRGARAYAQGHELHFAPGEYDPTSASGLELLAHEIAHIVQEAMSGRGAAGAKPGALKLDRDVESDADAMAARAGADRGERGAGTKPLRPLPPLGGPARPKLRVNENSDQWIDAHEIATVLVERGEDHRLVQLLQDWARDHVEQGRIFDTWRKALEAASDHHPARPARPARAYLTRQRIVLFTLFFLFLLAFGVFDSLQHLNRYEVRPGMENTAFVARRPLGPLVHAQHQLEALAQNTTVHALREATRDITEDDLHVDGGLEALAPAEAARVIAQVEEIGPQLHAVEPALQAVAPMVEELSGSTLANPARTGVFHEQIFFGPVPRVPHPAIGGHAHAHDGAAASAGGTATPAASEPVATGPAATPAAATSPTPTPTPAPPLPAAASAAATPRAAAATATDGTSPTPTPTPAPPLPAAAAAAATSASAAVQVPPNIGFFPDGVRAEQPNKLFAYGPPQAAYDRALLERAATEVARGFQGAQYGIVTANCQDFVGSVVARYAELGGTQVVPSWRNQFSLAFIDLVIDHAGWVLDRQVNAMVGSQLSLGGPASDCAQALCERLGVQPDTFAGAIDAMLDTDLPGTPSRPAIRLRTSLCASRPAAGAATTSAATTSAASSPTTNTASASTASPASSALSPASSALSPASSALSPASSALNPAGLAATSAVTSIVTAAAPTAAAVTVDTPIHVPLQGTTTARDLLCTPKPAVSASAAPVRPLEGVMFEVARLRGGPEIRRAVDGWGDFLGLTADSRARAVSDLTGRLARNLYERLGLARLCD
jgi:uncharacterized protein DUF4157